jgi:N-acetylgalactosamine 4-sulfate 6-O-sulfotransferase
MVGVIATIMTYQIIYIGDVVGKYPVYRREELPNNKETTKHRLLLKRASITPSSVNKASEDISMSLGPGRPVDQSNHDNGSHHTPHLTPTGDHRLPTLEQLIGSFKSLLPSHYLEGYKNPCWYANYTFPTSTLPALFPMGDITQVNMTSTKWFLARKAMTQMFMGEKNTLVCVPYFFLLGFPKCGTTHLANILASHHQVVSPRNKEINYWIRPFFSSFPLNILRQLRYLYHFQDPTHKIANDPSSLVTGDTSVQTASLTLYNLPANQTYPDAMPYLFSSLFPKSRFIFITRNPVYQVRSFYYYFNSFSCPHKPNASGFHITVVDHINAMRACMAEMGGEDACMFAYKRWLTTPNLRRCHSLDLSISMYYHPLSLWYKHIPKEQVFVLRLEDLTSNGNKTVQDMFRFLDLSPLPDSKVGYIQTRLYFQPNANVIFYLTKEEDNMFHHTKELLEAFFEPYNRKLSQLLNDERYLWK